MDNQAEYTQKVMRRIGDAVKKEVPQGFGFFICVFPYSEKDGHANYISTGRREDMIKMLRETAYRLERRQDDPNWKPLRSL